MIKKIHAYLGLLSFSALVVYGIAGLEASFGGDGQRIPQGRHEPYTAAAGASDREIADDVYRRLQPPLAAPIPSFAIKRNENNDLAFTFYSVNGPTAVTVLEKERRLRIEVVRNDLGRFFGGLHATTLGARSPDLRITLWKIYNEVAIWSLVGMVLTGAYLGLASRPRLRWSRYVLAAGTLGFVALYVVTR